MRVYVSVMTNGRSHTMTTSAVVSAYHLTMTRLWRAAVEEGRPIDAIEEMAAALPADDPLTPLRAQALRDLAPSSGHTQFARHASGPSPHHAHLRHQ